MSDKEWTALNDKLKSLVWDFPTSQSVPGGAGAASSGLGPLALTNGETGCTEEVWEHAERIVEKMTVVDKQGAKKFAQLMERNHPDAKMTDAGKRLMKEMEESLTKLDDEKNKLARIIRYKKMPDFCYKF